MKKFAALLAFSTVIAFTASARAADVVEPGPACHDWTGPYIGVHGGYAWGNGNVEDESDTDPKGWLFGPLGGWNFQTNCLVFGIEGDWGFGELDDSAGRVDDFDIEPNGHVRGRIGFSMDSLMPFVAVGLAIADADVRLPAVGDADSSRHTGLSIGGGLDWALADSLSLRVEYIFDTYSSENYDLGDGDHSVDFDTSTVRGAVIWNFGGLFF
jgi:outer membrane immunogenic protein